MELFPVALAGEGKHALFEIGQGRGGVGGHDGRKADERQPVDSLERTLRRRGRLGNGNCRAPAPHGHGTTGTLVRNNPVTVGEKTWRAICFVHGVSAPNPMTRTLQSMRNTVRTSITKAVQQRCRMHRRPVVARWSKFTDAGYLA
jgi:hypothetical protein